MRTLGARFVDGFLYLGILNAKCPIRHLPAGVGNRRVRKSLTDDSDRHAVHFFECVRFKNWVFKIFGFDVLRHKIDLASEVFVDDFHHPRFAVGELPMCRHHVHTQQLAGINHVLRVRPQTGGTALPRVAAVKQQSAWSAAAQLLHQGRQMGKTAHFAVLLRCPLKI